jgi:hypothetical protein
VIDQALAALIAAGQQKAEVKPADSATPSAGATPSPTPTASATPEPVKVSTVTVQFSSPDAKAVDAALAAVRGSAGVQGAATSSIAIGGTSVMRVTITGDIDQLAAALRARGYAVSAGSNALSIRR